MRLQSTAPNALISMAVSALLLGASTAFAQTAQNTPAAQDAQSAPGAQSAQSAVSAAAVQAAPGAAAATTQPPQNILLAQNTQNLQLAQNTPATPAQTAQNQAANAPAQTAGLEEVVVTARYREENLQQTPIAISAITAADIQQRGFNTAADIALAVPNASARPAQAAFGNTLTYYIRGVGQNDFQFAFEPGVGIYVDDVYYPTTMASQFDLMDLQSVQILRGPQGTLFGRGSIGGAVVYVSKQPTGSNTGFIEGTVGGLHRVDLRAGYDFALIPDKLFMRITGVSKKQDGYVDDIDFTCAYPQLSGTLPRQILNRDGNCKIGTMGGVDVSGARAQFRYLATDNLTVGLAFDYQRDDSEAAADTLTAVGPLVGGYATWSNAMQNGYSVNGVQVFKGYGVPFDSRFVPSNPYVSYATFTDPVSGLHFPPENNLNQKGIANTWDLKMTDDISAKLILAWRNWNGRFATDQSDAPLDVSLVDGIQSFTYRTAELRFTGTAFDKRLEWTAGGFYYDGNARSAQAVNLPGSQNLDAYFSDPVDNALLVNGLDILHVENKSGYLHGVWALLDNLHLEVGLRESNDLKDDNFDNTIVKALINVSKPHFDWKAGLSWQVDPAVMLYTSVSTGYKPPAFNPRPFQADQFVAVSGESLTAYEFGEKGDFLDHTLRLDVAAFYSDYKTRIVPTGGTDCLKNPDGSVVPGPLPNPQGGPSCLVNSIPNTLYVNVPGKISGGEFEGAWRPIEPLTFSLSAGLTKFTASGVNAGITPSGSPAYVPKWNGAASVQYEFAIPNGATITPRYDAYVQTQICSGVSSPVYNAIGSCTGGYTLHNVRVEYATMDRTWTVAAGLNNLTDHVYYYNKFDLTAFGEPTIEGQPAPPREWFLTLTRNFK